MMHSCIFSAFSLIFFVFGGVIVVIGGLPFVLGFSLFDLLNCNCFKCQSIAQPGVIESREDVAQSM